MKEAELIDLNRIIDYLKVKVEDCIYMYIDIKKYGLDNPDMKIWLDEDFNGINLVVMKYHTSISVYTRADIWDVKSTVDIIYAEKAKSVTATKQIIEQIYSLCQNDYTVYYGYVFEYTSFRSMEYNGVIERADEKDAREIAELIVQDEEIGSYYDVDDLAAQLAERMRTHMGRSYVIRDKGKIIAHIASYAEFEGIATTSGLIVDPDYRHGVYGSVLEGYIVDKFKEEDFRVYSFVIKRLRKMFLEEMGNPCVGEYGKMALKE